MMVSGDRLSLAHAMSEQQGFPRVLSVIEDGSVNRVVVDVSADLCWFRGHFPERPVLPGIVQLHWAVLVCRHLYGFHTSPHEVKRLKFKNVVIPPRTLELVVSHDRELEVVFSFSSLGEVNSEGRILFPEGQ